MMLDIKNKVDTDALMIMWRLCTPPHIVKGIVFINLVHFNTNRKLPKLIIVVFVNSECMITVSWKEDTKLVGRTTSFSMVHSSKLDIARSSALQILPTWFVVVAAADAMLLWFFHGINGSENPLDGIDQVSWTVCVLAFYQALSFLVHMSSSS
jgi:hypothetical protein